MRTLYLILAIIGTVVPLGLFAAFFAEHGGSFMDFVRGTFANQAASGFVLDLFISSFVFWAFMFTRPDGPRPWLYIALNLCIGLSCALPAYLYASTARSQ